MKQNRIWALLLALMVSLLVGCGSNASEQPAPTEAPTVTQTPAPTEAPQTPAPAGGETSQSSGLSNFDVDSQEAEAFALLIQEAVAAEELEALAELAAYPLYLGFAEGGVSVQTAQELLDLGAERVFSPELTQAIAQAETAGLTASKAGFSLTKDGRPNILFGLRDGALAVQGINY